MKLLAKVAILENGKKHEPGETFVTDEKTAETILRMGWADKTAEKKKASTRPAKK